jgi:DNA-binding MarR family transcriptional regulator
VTVGNCVHKEGRGSGYSGGVDATTARAGSGQEAALSGLLRGRLREVSVLIEQRGEAALAGTSLSLPLNHLLDAVVAEPGVTVTEIARRLGKSQQAMSQAADRLERLGFIERRVGAGRTVGLHATGAGATASADGVQRELKAEDQTRQALGPDRFDALVALLETARDALLADEADD